MAHDDQCHKMRQEMSRKLTWPYNLQTWPKWACGVS